MINLPGAEEIVTTVVAERILQLQLEELIPKHGLKMPKLADEGGSDPLLDNLVHHPLNQLDAQLSEQLVRRFPSTCQRKYTCKLLLENDAQEQVDVFPLSILLHFCPSLSLIQAVHKACPMALHCKLGQHQGATVHKPPEQPKKSTAARRCTWPSLLARMWPFWSSSIRSGRKVPCPRTIKDALLCI